MSQFLVTVLDVSPPVVTYCPQSKSVFLEPGKVMTSLSMSPSRHLFTVHVTQTSLLSMSMSNKRHFLHCPCHTNVTFVTVHVTQSSPCHCPCHTNVTLVTVNDLFVQSSQKVYWSEPTFKDNVKIEQIEASALPGGDLSLGKHVIVYQVSLSEIVSDNIPKI